MTTSRNRSTPARVPVEATGAHTGQIARLVREKGFGFIKPDDSEIEVFFHASALDRGVFDTLQEGNRVRFVGEHTHKGMRATDVFILER